MRIIFFLYLLCMSVSLFAKQETPISIVSEKQIIQGTYIQFGDAHKISGMIKGQDIRGAGLAGVLGIELFDLSIIYETNGYFSGFFYAFF